MKILVTGNLGYIGPVLISKLNLKGYETIGFDTDYFQNYEMLSEIEKPNKQIFKDLRNLEKEDLIGVDGIIHLGGLSNDPIGKLDFNLTYNINFQSSKNLLELASKLNVKRFIFASSCSIYGASGNKSDFLNETASLNPVSAYAYSKVFFEKLLLEYSTEQFCVSSMRNATAYGASPTTRFDLVLNDFVANAISRKSIDILSNGTPWRPLVHVNDISEVCLLLLKAEIKEINGQVYNIGTNEINYTVKELAEKVSRTINNSTKINILGKDDKDQRSYRVDFTKIKNLVNGKFKFTDLEDGILDLAQWVDESKKSINQFFSSDHIRLKKLEEHITDKKLTKELFWTNNE